MIEKLDQYLLNSETEAGMVLPVPLVEALANVTKATIVLRTAQKAYMGDRKNQDLGASVGRAAAGVDYSLAILEALLVPT